MVGQILLLCTDSGILEPIPVRGALHNVGHLCSLHGITLALQPAAQELQQAKPRSAALDGEEFYGT
jgi:hypothetical protein